MSRQVAKLVYDRKIGSMLRKAVLAYFAERANDDGSMIWASKKTIADEIECSKQAVINTVKQFLAEGILRENGFRKTQGGFTHIYDMDLAKIAALPKAKQSTELTSQNIDQSTPLEEPVNPVDPDQSTPLTQTVLEQSIEPDAKASKRAKPDKPKWQLPDWIPQDAWEGFEEMRRANRKPMTDRARNGIVDELQKLRGPPGAILDQSTRNNWQDVYELKDKTNGQSGNQQGGMGVTERAAHRAFSEITGGTGSFAGRGNQIPATDAGGSHRIIDAVPDTVRSIGYAGSG